MGTAIARTIHSVLKESSVQGRINEALGKKAAQFSSSLVSLVQSNQRLREANPDSVVAAAMTAALLDLPINKDLGFAHIVPYAGVAQFQMGYKGFIQLAMRSGQYRNLNAFVVYEGELLSYSKVSGEIVIDEASKTSDKPIGYAAYLELNNGFRHATYWTYDQVVEHSRRFSQAVKQGKKDSPWFTNFDAMALKTVIKSLLSKWGVLSIEMQRAVAFDQSAVTSFNGEPMFPDNTRAPVPMPLAVGELPPEPEPQDATPEGSGQAVPDDVPEVKDAGDAPASKERREAISKAFSALKITGDAVTKFIKDAGGERLTKLTNKVADVVEERMQILKDEAEQN